MRPTPDQLRQYADEGYTTQQIADLFPPMSRSAIAGMCHRHCISLGSGRRGRRAPTKPRPKRRYKRRKPIDLKDVFARQRFRREAEPICIWYGCLDPPIPSKPCCSQHQPFICSGIVKQLEETP